MDGLAARCARSGSRPTLTCLAIELEDVTIARAGRIVLSHVSAAVKTGEFIGYWALTARGRPPCCTPFSGCCGLRRVKSRYWADHRLAAIATPVICRNSARRSPSFACGGWDFVASALYGERWGLPLQGRADRREVGRAIATVEAENLSGRLLRELSGGELQRLLLAQALLGKPKLLLLDEPLLSLDPRFQQATVALVKRIQQAELITVLFTAHELNPLLDAVDRVLYLGQGRAALGTVDKVITSDVLSRLYGTPIEVLHVHNRILVVSGKGLEEVDAHRHDA